MPSGQPELAGRSASSPSPESVDASAKPARPPDAHHPAFGRRHFLWAGLSILFLWLLRGVWKRLGTRFNTPHESLYAKTTLAEVSDPREVVRPLIDEDHPFDVVATVWTTIQGAQQSWMAMKPERILFSDTIFRGVSFKSNGAHANVNLSIPLEGFSEAKVLENYDLRASFTLVPQSPSLLDAFLDYHSWRPFHWIREPKMSPPEDGLRPEDFIGKVPDPKQQAIDSYGITVPLIEFSYIESSCADDSPKPSGFAPRSYNTLAKFPIETTKGMSPLEYHPHVVTRTDLRVVKMTELYNAERYDRLHGALRANNTLNGCPSFFSEGTNWGRNIKPIDARNCERTFRLRANMETKIEVEVPSQQGLPSIAWAYAPFIDAFPGSWGPMDLVPMPVNREGCATKPPNSFTGETLNFTWTVALSFPSPGKHFLAERLVKALGRDLYGPTITPYQKAQAQSVAQHIHWLHGHKFTETANIGTSIIVKATAAILGVIVLPRLSMNYWNTRSSTAGISQLGSIMIAIGGLCSFFKSQYEDWSEENAHGIANDMPAITLLFTATAAYTTLLMVTASFRLERVNAFPFFKRREPTRLERTSLKKEMHGKTTLMITIFVATLLVDVAAQTFLSQCIIIPRAGPAPEDGLAIWQERIVHSIKDLVPGVLPLLGEVYQLNFNFRLKTFAGQSKSGAWLILLVFCLERVKSVPWVVGELPVADPVTLADLVYIMPPVVAVVQSLAYPEVKQDIEDEHTD